MVVDDSLNITNTSSSSSSSSIACSRSVLKKFFQMEEREKYSKLLAMSMKEKASDPVNGVDISLALRELQTLKDGSLKLAPLRPESSYCSNDYKFLPYDEPVSALKARKHFSLSDQTKGYDLEEKERYRELLKFYSTGSLTSSSEATSTHDFTPKSDQSHDFSYHRSSSVLPYSDSRWQSMLNGPSSLSMAKSGSTGKSCRLDTILPIVQQARQALDKLHKTCSLMPSSSSAASSSPHSDCTSQASVVKKLNNGPLTATLLNNNHTPDDVISLDLDDEKNELRSSTMISDGSVPSTSKYGFLTERQSSTSFPAKFDINAFNRRFTSTDPIRLCRQIREEYGPFAQIRRNEAERLLLEAKLRLQARCAKRDSLEEEIRLRIKLEGLVLPEEEEEEEKEFISLTDEQLSVIQNAFQNPNNKILVKKFDIEIRIPDLATLKPSQWLNDEVINFYLNLIAERSGASGLPSVHVFSTFFLTKLKSATGFAGVKRWTKKVDIFVKDLVLVPVHLTVHWCLAVIDFRNKTLSYYDSMSGSDNDVLLTLKKYLKDESFDKKKQEFDGSDYRLLTLKGIPQQMNGSDCGVFACQFAEYISRQAELTFSQEHMPYLRQRMMYEILTGKLL